MTRPKTRTALSLVTTQKKTPTAKPAAKGPATKEQVQEMSQRIYQVLEKDPRALDKAAKILTDWTGGSATKRKIPA